MPHVSAKKVHCCPKNSAKEKSAKKDAKKSKRIKQATNKTDITDYLAFTKQFLSALTDCNTYTIKNVLSRSGNYQYYGDELYLLPALMDSLNGLKTVRPGLHLGTRKKNRFEPAHALAMALQPRDVRQCSECTEDEAIRYLQGETISCAPELKSWTLVCYQGISLGWGKASNGILKNHYPKGLRIY